MKNTTEFEYGQIRGEQCPHCHMNDTYTLQKSTTWASLMFFTLYPKEKAYTRHCTNCKASSEVSDIQARRIIEQDFQKIERTHTLKSIFKKVLPFLLIAAIVFCIVALVMDNKRIAFKRMVADQEDGYYEFFDEEGFLLAAITKTQGEAFYDLFIEQEQILAYEYDDINDDLIMEHYYHEDNGEWQYIEENAGALIDKNGLCIRNFYYDVVEKDIFYYYGVEDIDGISYGDKTVYYMTHFKEEGVEDHYTYVYVKSDSDEMILFFSSMIESVSFYDYEESRLIRYEYYDFTNLDEDKRSSLNEKYDTSAEEMRALIDSLSIEPTETTDYQYYLDTNIVEKMVMSYTITESGSMMRDSIFYDVFKDGRYYVTRLVEGAYSK